MPPDGMLVNRAPVGGRVEGEAIVRLPSFAVWRDLSGEMLYSRNKVCVTCPGITVTARKVENANVTGKV